MQTVFVIMASQGEYSDRNEWPVLVVTSESVAKEKVLYFSANDIYSIMREDEEYKEYINQRQKLNLFDRDKLNEKYNSIFIRITNQSLEESKLLTVEQLQKLVNEKKYITDKISYYYSKCEMHE